jgi:glycosyltransferase involved in cell wall biosynthesis
MPSLKKNWIMPKTLTALVVVHNEEHRVATCLERLSFADELVVLCDRCTDHTPTIARTFNAIVIEGAWPLEGDRRNAGLQGCTKDYILEIDADEWVTPELAIEIKQILNNPMDDYYLIPIHNYIGKRLVQHGWGGSFGVRRKHILFKNGIKSWGVGRVHPPIYIKSTKKGILTHPIVHHIDNDLSDMWARLNRYTTAKAQDMVDTNTLGRKISHYRRFFTRFFQCYIRRHGYKEGVYGLSIALCAGLFPLLSYIKAKEILDSRGG